jgi:hypothetical protein
MSKQDISLWSEEHRSEFLKNAYLEIGDTYLIDTDNAKAHLPAKETIAEDIIRLCMNEKYLQFPTKHILNMDLFPYQMSILETLWTKRLPMILAARGGSKTTMLAVYIALRAILNQGIKIVVAGAGLRQSGLVFEAIEQMWKNSPILRDICGHDNPPKRGVLGYTWSVGKSKITGIPIGTGEKIRGLRANIIVCDEFGSINPDIFETVIRGFAAVHSHNTFEKVQQAYQESLLKKMGITLEDTEKEDKFSLSGNQIILSGTATYQFNHFYKYYQSYCDILYAKGGKKVSSSEYAVIRIPHDKLPLGLMDPTIMEQGESTMDSGIFKMEYGCVFSKDSEGFFPASLIYNCTCPTRCGDEEVSFNVELKGDPTKEYVMGIDPASERDNLVITIIKIEDPRRQVYTWSANRKRFEADKKKRKSEYKDVDDYNTFIIQKIHDLASRFNLKRIHLDAGGGGRSIVEGLKDTSKLKKDQVCIYDMDDDMVSGEEGIHIIKVIQFSKRDWYESAHYNLLKDLTIKKHLFPEYDAVSIEQSRFQGLEGCLVRDISEDIQYEIEECKYQTTLIQEQTTAKGMKKWDLPTIKGVVTESVQIKLKRDHFTSLLLANDAAREHINDDDDTITTYGGISSREARSRKIEPENQMYQGRGLKSMKKTGYNKSSYLKSNKPDSGGTVNY